MAISAGNYIIRSALDENTVILTSAGSKKKGAYVVSGSLTELDSRCYWKASVVSTSYNRFYNLNAGNTNGNMMTASVAANKACTQGVYKAATGDWNAVASGNTMTVRGSSVSTYFLKPKGNANLYLTVPENGGTLYLSAALDDTTAQEFYFDASTYVNTKLATPTNLTVDGSTAYIASSNVTNLVKPRWNSSSTATIYEMRTRTRMYDGLGFVGDWGDWTDWTMTTASKYSAGIMRSDTSVSLPAVDNSTYSQTDVQIEVRLTSATSSANYNKTGSVTHGAAVSAVISKWKSPSFSVTAAVCTRYGLKLTYSSDYTIAGNTLNVVSVMDGATELAKNYILTKQDYQGDIIVDWDAMTGIPDENDSLDVTVQLIEANGIVSKTVTATLTVTYDSEEGLSFTPTYTLTNRMTIEAKLTAYDNIDCYLQTKDVAGNDTWTKCEEIAPPSSSYRVFEIAPAFGSAPTVMFVVTHTSGGNTQWGYKKETLSYNISTLSYVWNWVDDDRIPHAYIMKYRAGAIVQPGDSMTLPVTKFTTIAREYPVFRYTKSIDRTLDIEGAILNREADTHATKADAERLATANHTVYRQPNGKWYQTALKAVAFTRETAHYAIQIQQEAESR